MKITKAQLEQIIKEELILLAEQGKLSEGVLDRLRARAVGLGSKAGAAASRLGAKAASGLGAQTAAGEMTAKAGEREKAALEKAKRSLAKTHGKKIVKLYKQLDVLLKKVQKDASILGLGDDAFTQLERAVLNLEDQIRHLQAAEVTSKPLSKPSYGGAPGDEDDPVAISRKIRQAARAPKKEKKE